MVLQQIYNIYLREFETRKESVPDPERHGNLTVEEVFEEADGRVIEELMLFNEQYKNYQVMLADKLFELERQVVELQAHPQEHQVAADGEVGPD